MHPPPRYPAGEPLPPPPEAYRGLLMRVAPPRRERYGLHALLFALTAATTVWAGGMWAGRAALWEAQGLALYLDPVFLADGLRYAIPFLAFLTVHEFGHYVAARRHRVDVSLPYFIPLPPGLPILNIGTLGAVIRIRQLIPHTRQLFDIGVAGPLAGFVVALAALLYAVATLPPITYVFDLGPGHEALQAYVRETGRWPAEPGRDAFGFGPVAVGDTPLFVALRALVPDLPPAWELYHYPVLFAGWLGLFFTALNLLPVGQLDGGHLTYALFGRRWHGRIARATVWLLLASGALGTVADTGPLLALLAEEMGWPGWAGPALAWLGVALLTRWLLHRAFPETVHAALAWVALLTAVALAERVGGVASAVGWSGWLLWGALLVLVVKVDHPPALIEAPLSRGRRVLGYLTLAILLLCFSPRPIYLA